MNCLAFERLLDEGEPTRLPAVAQAHARECTRCARSLARAHSLEHALARHFEPSDTSGAGMAEDFVDRIMARVERGEARGVRWLTLPDALPWWVRAAAEPSVALAATVAALLLWRGDLLLAGARAWFPIAAAAPGRLAEVASTAGLGGFERSLALAFVPGPDAHWSVAAAMALGVTPLLALAGYGLWRLGERLAGPAGAAALR